MNFMKIQSALVRQLRVQRAWSQEHLAEVAALSLRTVQRVEADGGASAETRMALAAAFGIDVAALNTPAAAPVPPMAGSPTVESLQPSAVPLGPAAFTAGAATEAAPRQPLTFDQYRMLRLAVVMVLVLAVDGVHNGAITWSRWPLLVVGVLLVLRLFRSKWVQPRVRTR